MTKPLESMSARELAEAIKLHVAARNGGEVIVHPILGEVIARLEAHPAQQIADLTQGIITKDYVTNPETLEIEPCWMLWEKGAIPNSSTGIWDSAYSCVRIHLPDDGRDWHEAIYRPGGGKA